MPGPVEAVDDTLQLYFLCAHPSLTPASPVALTLRAVGGSSCPTRYGHHRVSSCVTSRAKAARPDRRRREVFVACPQLGSVGSGTSC